MVIFVAGTGTDVGKTFVCGLLARVLAGTGYSVKYQKWVSTGNRKRSDDAGFVYGLLGRKQAALPGSDETPYCLEFPASPHLAAERECVEIQKERIGEAFRRLSPDEGILVVEGVGGMLVPLSRSLLLADLVSALSIPAVIVARSGLGTINHTLLTIEACVRRGVDVTGVVYNAQGGEDPVLEEDNMRTVSEFSNIEALGLIPRVEDPLDAVPFMMPVAERIVKKLAVKG